MKINITLLILLLVCSLSVKAQSTKEEYRIISIEDLIAQADSLHGEKVEIVGLVAHLCGVDGKKMKLKSPGGALVKIVPKSEKEAFDSSLIKQVVCVKGVLEITRIEKVYVDKMEKEGTLLCHIDHSACKDKPWVNNKIETGADVEIVKKYIAKLRKMMAESGKDYINSVCICADKVEPLNP